MIISFDHEQAWLNAFFSRVKVLIEFFTRIRVSGGGFRDGVLGAVPSQVRFFLKIIVYR